MQRGNAAFNAGKYPAAEAAYSEAILLLEAAPAVAGPLLAKLHSNRAAARLMRHAPQEALADCTAALQANAAYTRAAVRGATCHLRLGDFGAAATMLRGSQPHASSATAARELADKLLEVEQLQAAYAKVQEQVLQASTADQITTALRELDATLLPALAAAPPAFQLRAHALLRLGRREEALSAASWQTSPQATLAATDAWLWWTQAQVALAAGDVAQAEKALQSQTARQHLASAAAAVQPADAGAAAALSLRLPMQTETVAALDEARLVARLKEQGNTAIKAGDHEAAVRHYTAALAALPPPLPAAAAVLHANRAAAHQGLGAVAEALADCGRARALDPTYAKALSRSAALWLEAGRPAAAVEALEALQGLSAKLKPAERQELGSRLGRARAAAAGRSQPDHYRLLGLKQGASADDVRRAYKKFALRMHPDKAASACRFGTSIVPGTPLVGDASAIEAAVQEQANKLFASISEANTVLSDPVRRSEYDALYNVNPGLSRPGGAGMRRSGGQPAGFYTQQQSSTASYRRSGFSNFSSYGNYGAGGYSYYETRPAGQRGRHQQQQQQYTYSWAESDEEDDDTWTRGKGGTSYSWDYY